ncbi:MAG: hypothetical protein BGO14_02015 [Chlamydiales bacterium 38-26]|nr:hypothetical protein [Chlamydiales bacterium]OJV08218.1 MAG: hypothetical protein BGO14_02015 [Chlamydiales bacterium 38-26]
MTKIQPNLTQDLELLKDELKPLEKSNKIGQFVGRAVRKLENAFNKLEHLFKEGKWESKEIRGYHELKQKIEQLNKDWEKASNTYHFKSSAIVQGAKEEYIKLNQEMKQNLSTMAEIFEVIENKIGDNKKKANDLTLIQQIVKNLKISIDKEIEFVQQGTKMRDSQKVKQEKDVDKKHPQKETTSMEAPDTLDVSESSSELVKGERLSKKEKALNRSQELKGKRKAVSEEELSTSSKKSKRKAVSAEELSTSSKKSKSSPFKAETREESPNVETSVKKEKIEEPKVNKKPQKGKVKELKFEDLEPTDFDPLKKR